MEGKTDAGWWIGFGLIGRPGDVVIGVAVLHPSLGAKGLLLVLPLWGSFTGPPSEEALLTAALLTEGGFGGRQILVKALEKALPWTRGATKVVVDEDLTERLKNSPLAPRYREVLSEWKLPIPFGPEGDLKALATRVARFLKEKTAPIPTEPMKVIAEKDGFTICLLGKDKKETYYGLMLEVRPEDLPPWHGEVLESPW